MSADAWTNETATDITIRRADQVERAGWRYPFNPHPKQALASSYMVDEILMGGSAGPGKGHPVSVANMRYTTPMGQPQDREVQVLTPFGFKPFADVKVGDQLTNPDGSIQRVIQVFELGERDIYRVTFSDGATTLVTDDHLWLVNYSGKKYKAERTYPVDAGWSTKTSAVIKTTATLRDHLDTCHAAAANGKRPNWPLIPLTEPTPFTFGVRKPETTHPIKPYLLGALLGDGSLTKNRPQFHCFDQEIAQFIRDDGDDLKCVPYTNRETPQSACFVLGDTIGPAVDRLDLRHHSYNKRIPRNYLLASLDIRWNLVRGLMDTDGTVSTGGDATYSTSSPGLADDIVWLLRSLGFRANTTSRIPTYTYQGEKKQGRRSYTIHIQGDRVPDLFRLPRKRDRCKYGMNGGQRVKRRMVSIEHVGVGEARCIKVDHPNSLYITDDFIVTHNTDWMLAELVNLSLAIPHVKTLLLRNTYGELQEEIIPRLEERIPTWVGKYSSKLRSYVFYNGARLRLGYLEHEKHQQKYIGAEYAAIGFDELTLLPWNSYQFLASRARATGHVATMLTKLGLRPRRLATSNPGGPYHTPVKKHFVDPAPPNTIYQDPDTGLTRVYVPATVDDNPSMPPQYRRLLESLPTEKRKALLEGSWDILEGARFSAWNAARHVITPTQLPPDLLSGERVIAVDYGFADPFAAVWMVKLGSGLIVVYRELYSTELTPQQQAEMILNHTTEAEWEDGISIVMDPAMWGRRDASAPKTGNPNIPPVSSPAHTYQTVLGRVPIRANNDRRTGWAMIDEKLRVHDDGWPRLVVYDWCRDLIRTLPALERGKLKPDDVNQNPKQEDHLADALRYGAMHLAARTPSAGDGDGAVRGSEMLTRGLLTRRW